MSGEFDRIAEIRRRASRGAASVVLGIGDDAAILRPTPGFDVVLSTDLLVESVHFQLDWISPELLGHKALAVALSDLAAMGAHPRGALFSIAMPPTLDAAWMRRFYDGALALADRYNVEIVGGDTSSSPGVLVVDSIVVGEVEQGRALRRAGARAGDDLWVSGQLGSSARGLALLAAGRRFATATEAERGAIQAHLAPEPRIALGRALVERDLATAALDLSDGLSSDVGHLCDESSVGVVLDCAPLTAFGNLADALHGGEQYELLFAARPSSASALESLARELGIELTRIGRFGGHAHERLLARGDAREILVARGWDHFRT